RPHDHRRPRLPEDGAGHPPPLPADARTQVGHFHGSLRHLHRRLQQLRPDPGQPGDPGRRLCPRLPAAPGAVDLRPDDAPGQDSAAERQRERRPQPGVIRAATKGAMYIRVNPRDNVAILVHPDGLVAREAIPQSHKIALHRLEPGQPVVRYGQTIGLANRAIDAGSWVREELLDMPAAPPLDSLSLATAVPPALPPLENYTFEGYPTGDGATGTRNLLGLATTVQCVAPTVEYAAQRIRAEILPRFPNVDGVVAITHSYGCGVAIDAPGAAVPIRTLQHIALHVNLAGQPLVVSLGCEKLQPARLFGSDVEGALPGSFPILGEGNVIRRQDERGFGESVAAI